MGRTPGYGSDGEGASKGGEEALLSSFGVRAFLEAKNDPGGYGYFIARLAIHEDECLDSLDITFSNGQRSLPAHALPAPSRGISSGASTAHKLQITMTLMRLHHEQRLNLEQSPSSTPLPTRALRLQTLNTASLNGLLNGFSC